MASENGRRRVVITGMGAVTPLGNDVETFWENLVAGKGGAGPIQAFDPSEFAVHFACELKDFDPTQWIEYRKARRMDRFTQMILGRARVTDWPSHHCGSHVERSIGGSNVLIVEIEQGRLIGSLDERSTGSAEIAAGEERLCADVLCRCHEQRVVRLSRRLPHPVDEAA